MPTDGWFKENPKVSAYISAELSQSLEEWMREKNVKKVSQALTQILENYLGVVQSEPNKPADDNTRLEALEEKVANLSQELAELREAIANVQTESRPKVDQSKSKGQLSLLEQTKTNTQDSSPKVDHSSLNNEDSKPTQIASLERIEGSARKMSELTGVNRQVLEKRSKDTELGTPLSLIDNKPYEIDGKPYTLQCVERPNKPRSPSKWVAEPL